MFRFLRSIWDRLQDGWETPTTPRPGNPAPTPPSTPPPTPPTPPVPPAPVILKAVTLRDVKYGASALQAMDVYIPERSEGEKFPVIFMVHGGGWWQGDKEMPNVIKNKLAYWGSRYIIVSVNYRLDGTKPDQQILDVVDAYRWMLASATSWQIDKDRIVGMGHSAGGHLMCMSIVGGYLPQDVLPACSVILDSGGYNIQDVMKYPHPDIYDNAFGTDVEYQRAMSPTLVMDRKVNPMFLVYRNSNEAGQLPESAIQVSRFADKARSFESDITEYPSNLKHGPINGELGLPSKYTTDVDNWMESKLDL